MQYNPVDGVFWKPGSAPTIGYAGGKIMALFCDQVGWLLAGSIRMAVKRSGSDFTAVILG